MNQSNKALDASSNDTIRFSILCTTIKDVLLSAKLAISTLFAIRKKFAKKKKRKKRKKEKEVGLELSPVERQIVFLANS